MSLSQITKYNHTNTETYKNKADNGQEWQTLHSKLSLFDFHALLPDKSDSICRLFYSNCNGISINNTINAHLQQKKKMTKKRSNNNMSPDFVRGDIIIRNAANTISLLKLRLGDLINKHLKV